MNVRILLIDGSKIFRMGMRALLDGNSGLQIVGEAEDPRAAEAVLATLAPNVIVLDLDAGDRTFSVVATSLRAVAPAARLLVLSTKVSDTVVRQTVLGGANGYAFKSQSPEEIVAAIEGVARGERVVPSGLSAAGDGARAASSGLERLSAREREIFDLIIWGQTNKQVALRLGISVKTVETHRSHINGKLQVHSAAELVRLASLCGALAEGGGPPAPTPQDLPRRPAPSRLARAS